MQDDFKSRRHNVLIIVVSELKELVTDDTKREIGLRNVMIDR